MGPFAGRDSKLLGSQLHPLCCQVGSQLHPWIHLPSWIHLVTTLDSKWVQLAVLGAPAPRSEGPRSG